jgi:hypothetical protein
LPARRQCAGFGSGSRQRKVDPDVPKTEPAEADAIRQI